ncbi:hypothetical protein AB0890_35720 [Streptomyces sp. NPDC005406]|uniref:hypothetical protein n=1 Tax=Streptomyces sp. NPDC005406 TaxID=3155339 RepID=UPI003455F758
MFVATRETGAFGEALARHSFVPGSHTDDALLLTDYQRALDPYEQAEQNFVGDRKPGGRRRWAVCPR